MSYKNYFTEKMPTIAIISSLLLMTACGTYQQVGTDNDGIYSSTTPSVEQETYAEVTNTGSNYYENYFKEKSSELELYAEDEVFTDVDDYEGDYVENDSVQVQRESYAGWGQENSNVTINVYGGSGFYNAYYSPFYYGYSPYSYGYYPRYNYGYYSPYYGYGYGYGYGGGYYPPYYGGGYYPPYYGGGYYGGSYYRNNVAYVNGRRGSYANTSGRYASSRYYDTDKIYTNNTRRNATDNTTVTRRSRTKSAYPSTGTRSENEVRTRTNSDVNTPRVRTNTNNTPRVRTNTNNTPRVRTNDVPTRTNTTPTAPTRSNNTNVTPRRNSAPSPSMSGSSGGSRSSSGSTRGSSGGRRGGGN